MLSEQTGRYKFNPDINPASRKMVGNSRERTSTSPRPPPVLEHSFQPIINEESRRLAEQTYYENQGEPRWNQLYENYSKIKEKEDKRRMEQKQKEEEEIRKSCTFKPQITPSKHYYSSMGNPYAPGGSG